MEIHIFSSDGQTRLGYFVHIFIDPSAEMLPPTINDHEDGSSILSEAVDQETSKGEKNCTKIVLPFTSLWFTLIFYCSGNRATKETRVKCKEQMHRQRDVVCDW